MERKGFGLELARVFSFDLKFGGSRRTQFYRRLFGYTSRSRHLRKDGSLKTYLHRSRGLLQEIPHLRLGRSVIAVPKQAAPRLRSFFSDPRWGPLELHEFDALLPPEPRLQAMEEALRRPLELAPKRWASLGQTIEELSALARGPPDPTLAERARRALRAAEGLMELDWSEGREFSRALRAKLEPLRKLGELMG